MSSNTKAQNQELLEEKKLISSPKFAAIIKAIFI